MLRSAGEEEAAIDEYRAAALQLALSGAGHLAAGNLLLEKAGRPDMAFGHYAAGWALRPAPNALPCAIKIAHLLADRGDLPALRSLLHEADSHLTVASGTVEPGHFYNEVAALGDRPTLAPAREELRDRALMGLASHLRARARTDEKANLLVPALLAKPAHWPSAIVSDAAFAVAAATRPRRASGPPPAPAAGAAGRVQLCPGGVSAVAGAYRTGDVFVGTDRGEVWAFRPATSEVALVVSYGLPVASLAADPSGDRLVVLRSYPSGRGAINSYAREPDGRYRLMTGSTMESMTDPWLTPVLRTSAEDLVGLWDGESFHILAVASLASLGSFACPPGEPPPPAALLLGREDVDGVGCSILMHNLDQWYEIDSRGRLLRPTGLRWRPASPGEGLRAAPLSWLVDSGDGFELVGLSARRHLALVPVVGRRAAHPEFGLQAGRRGYLAAAIVRPGLVAGVSRSRIDWLQTSSSQFRPWRMRPGGVPSAVAAFSSRPTGELIVVGRDGVLVRLPVPS